MLLLEFGDICCIIWLQHIIHARQYMVPLTRYVKLRVGHAPGMPGTFSPPLRVSDPDMHHGTCVTHMSWFTLGSLTGGFLWSWWREKRSRHSRRMPVCNPQFYISGILGVILAAMLVLLPGYCCVCVPWTTPRHCNSSWYRASENIILEYHSLIPLSCDIQTSVFCWSTGGSLIDGLVVCVQEAIVTSCEVRYFKPTWSQATL